MKIKVYNNVPRDAHEYVVLSRPVENIILMREDIKKMTGSYPPMDYEAPFGYVTKEKRYVPSNYAKRIRCRHAPRETVREAIVRDCTTI